MATAHAWHPRIDLSHAVWPRTPPIMEDELLSSWLVRTALAHGCAPLALAGIVWPGWRAFCGDLDRGMSAERAGSLARLAGCTASQVQSCCLGSFVEMLWGKPWNHVGTWPWILAREAETCVVPLDCSSVPSASRNQSLITASEVGLPGTPFVLSIMFGSLTDVRSAGQRCNLTVYYRLTKPVVPVIVAGTVLRVHQSKALLTLSCYFNSPRMSAVAAAVLQEANICMRKTGFLGKGYSVFCSFCPASSNSIYQCRPQ